MEAGKETFTYDSLDFPSFPPLLASSGTARFCRFHMLYIMFVFFLDGATICLELYTQDTYIFCVHVHVCALVNMASGGSGIRF